MMLPLPRHGVGPAALPEWLRDAALCVLLLALSFTAYARVTECGFINYDDDVVITKNPRVQHGLNLADLAWAWRSTDIYWQPLTWMSFQFDTACHGLDPSWFHRTNLILHAANGVLLFLFLRRITGARWRAAVVAAFFAVHPMHVESVAWATERKDVLSTFFGLLALGAYARYAGRPSRRAYLVVALPTALAMAAKPMLLTLPCLFLLLDYWPPGRMGERRNWIALIVEKLPFLGFSVAIAIATLLAQSRCGAMYDTENLPWSWRIGNALVGYGSYLFMTVWPRNLAILYPLPESGPSLGKAAASLVVLLAISTLVAVRRRPYLVVGWLWFLLTLVPVSGLFQAGPQALADRFVYLPHIGLFLLLVWTTGEWAEKLPRGRWILGLTGGVSLALCLALTLRQVGYWRDSETVWLRALEVTNGNSVAHVGLGTYLSDRHRWDESIGHFREAIRLSAKPHWQYCYALAEGLEAQGRWNEALEWSTKACSIAPGEESPKLQHGSFLLKSGRVREALPLLTEAVRLDPADGEARHNLGLAQERLGCTDAALESYRKAIELRPDVADPRAALAILLERLGRCKEAQDQLIVVCRLDSDWAEKMHARAAKLATASDSAASAAFALRLAHLACLATANRRPEFLATYAAAQEKLARFQTVGATNRTAAALPSANAAQELVPTPTIPR